MFGKFPQREVLSPLLWSSVVDSLLRQLNRYRWRPIGFTDDIRGMLGVVLRDLVQGTLGRAVGWYESKKFSIHSEKTAAVVFATKYKIKI